MKLWQPTPAALWQGRDDSAEAANALRLFQTIVRAERFEPEMLAGDIALLGFACDEGVRRNKGRTGAERGPETLRRALANMASHDGHDRCVDMGTIHVADDALEAAQQALREAASVRWSSAAVMRRPSATAPGFWTRFPGRRSALLILTRIWIYVSPTGPAPVRHSVSWRWPAKRSGALFITPASA